MNAATLSDAAALSDEVIHYAKKLILESFPWNQEMNVVISKLCAQAKANRGERKAWFRMTEDGKPVCISIENLASQPDWIKEKWKDAIPLYTRGTP
jgi:hypothetical protein